MARTSRSSWIEAGFILLRDGGQDALTIERLSGALGKTKGSFYHHFASMDAYLVATLEAWEARNTLDPIAEANRVKSARSRRRVLSDAARRLDPGLEIAVRAWSLRDPRARGFVERVDALRIGYLAELMPESLSRARRELLGRVEYAGFLGNQQLDPTLSRPDTRQAEKLLALALTRLEEEPDR